MLSAISKMLSVPGGIQVPKSEENRKGVEIWSRRYIK